MNEASSQKKNVKQGKYATNRMLMPHYEGLAIIDPQS